MRRFCKGYGGEGSMSRAVLILGQVCVNARAISWVTKAPAGTRLEFKAPKRTLPQNARMWAMLTDIAGQVEWHGLKLSADDWKLIFLDGLKAELRLVPNINGTGFVNLGRSSSDLTVAEMADLMTLIEAFGANHGVVFHDARGA
jgi:hypothetical protein